VWINNVPAGQKTEVALRWVKALPLRNQTIKNPVVRVGRHQVTLPVKMSPGMYLELDQDCKLYSKEGKLLETVVPSGAIPVLQKGENKMEVEYRSGGSLTPRADVTVMIKGGN